MDENQDLSLEELDQTEVSADRKLQVRNRFQQLAEAKIKAQSEKDAAEKAKADAEAKVAQLERESAFYKTFNQVSSKYPEASNFQDKIKEKVDQGYDLEDAAVSVLNKEGKLTASHSQVRTLQAEGGSALNNIQEGDKPINEMPASEKLAALQEMEKSGELTQALRAGINRS